MSETYNVSDAPRRRIFPDQPADSWDNVTAEAYENCYRVFELARNEAGSWYRSVNRFMQHRQFLREWNQPERTAQAKNCANHAHTHIRKFWAAKTKYWQARRLYIAALKLLDPENEPPAHIPSRALYKFRRRGWDCG